METANKENNRRQARLAAVQAYVDREYEQFERLRFDELSRKVQTFEKGFWRDITDRDVNSIAVGCAMECGQNISAQDVNIVLRSDMVPTIHPLRDYLDHCPAYEADKMPDWIDELAKEVKPLSPGVAGPFPQNASLRARDNNSQLLWRKCFKKWFVGMVAGWMSDEVVNHQVLVLIGKQGIYKTTWLEHIIPPELRQYLSKLSSSRELSKDDRIRTAEFGLINMDEIDSMSPRELNVLKSVITTTDVNERAAYGYTKERRIRCASFCASGNNKQFLTDDTGNRRWLPFEVESIENPWGRIEMWPYIYGQAKYLIEKGFPYWFDMEETERMEAHKQAFEMPHNEAELLLAYFRPAGPEDASNANFYSASEIHGRLKNWGSIERPMPLNKFGELLRTSGFEVRKSNGRKGYTVVQLKPEMDSNMMAKQIFNEQGQQGR